MKPIVVIEWEDASAHISAYFDNVMKANNIVKTYGVLIHTDKQKTIIMTHDGNDDGDCDYLRIPTSIIRKVTELRKGKKIIIDHLNKESK